MTDYKNVLFSSQLVPGLLCCINKNLIASLNTTRTMYILMELKWSQLIAWLCMFNGSFCGTD